MENEKYELLFDLKRTLNSVEHKIMVSCRFTRTTEMIFETVKSLVEAYEKFFELGFTYFLGDEKHLSLNNVSFIDKMRLLSNYFEEKKIFIDLSDYKLLKRILISDYESIGQYRKNLSMVVQLEDEEVIITVSKLVEFYKNLENIYETLNPDRFDF